MITLLQKLKELAIHLETLDSVFSDNKNYSNTCDFEIYLENKKQLMDLTNKPIKKGTLKINKIKTTDKPVPLSFTDEVYHQYDRQMKLADIIQYIFFSRGVYSLFQGNRFESDNVPLFLKIILRYVNMLMVYETLTVDSKLRKSLLKNLSNLIKNDHGYKQLLEWEENVGLTEANVKADSPGEYFDTLLPKTAGGLWHELLVFALILKYNVGYIFPLFTNQKIISRESKLSPPDLIILHNKTYRYYGIEIGQLKERQSGTFMSPTGIPVIPVDTLNARISDRCPICLKWICICPFVIEVFSESVSNEYYDEIRCLTDCNKFAPTEIVNGACPYAKYSKKDTEYTFGTGYHYHYRCCIDNDRNIIEKIKNSKYFKDLGKLRTDDEFRETNKGKIRKSFNYIKTHSVWYSELKRLIDMNK